MNTRTTTAGPQLEHLAAHARLDLDSERAAEVAPMLDQVAGLLDTLDSIDIGETPAATAFDARWQ